ncbi:MAG: NfeD family protein [Aliidongia sp.]|jgi:membrane protein implicated in regulation of membrane protease activity
MDNWIWGAVGAVLLVVEMLAPGYFLVFPALGALAVTGFGFIMPLDLPAQLLLFAVVTSLLFALCFRLYRGLTAGGTPSLINSSDRLIGAAATVEEPITAGRGKIRLGDTVWLACGPDLPSGSAVTVIGVDGTVLQVAPRR